MSPSPNCSRLCNELGLKACDPKDRMHVPSVHVDYGQTHCIGAGSLEAIPCDQVDFNLTGRIQTTHRKLEAVSRRCALTERLIQQRGRALLAARRRFPREEAYFSPQTHKEADDGPPAPGDQTQTVATQTIEIGGPMLISDKDAVLDSPSTPSEDMVGTSSEAKVSHPRWQADAGDDPAFQSVIILETGQKEPISLLQQVFLDSPQLPLSSQDRSVKPAEPFLCSASSGSQVDTEFSEVLASSCLHGNPLWPPHAKWSARTGCSGVDQTLSSSCEGDQQQQQVGCVTSIPPLHLAEVSRANASSRWQQPWSDVEPARGTDECPGHRQNCDVITGHGGACAEVAANLHDQQEDLASLPFDTEQQLLPSSVVAGTVSTLMSRNGQHYIGPLQMVEWTYAPGCFVHLRTRATWTTQAKLLLSMPAGLAMQR
eukprot:CAMPEP_0172755134 /NCGR_PEP_ID=MMETSP1074-20121228/159300_1 /TAXON_ID=2916 /ORGANISM="Ceratium fusus, Strain PA161109" /LENGTH=427 /DNA_ID=CAMNT_0013588179 /DNA_START=33 /DNA_END=1317 /DNA_ORIENTATION=-